jgi:hypothetical protein
MCNKRGWVIIMVEVLYDIEISRDANLYVAKMQSKRKGARQYKSPNFEEILEQLVKDIQEEFED